MISQDFLGRLQRDYRRGEFLYPAYGRQSVAEIGPTVGKLLGVPQARAALPRDFFGGVNPHPGKVLLFLVDGLGFNHVADNLNRIPLFSLLERQGNIFPLTSVFPSTTPAALTAIHTALTPQEHGLPEWTVYLEEVDNIVETLPFKFIGNSQRDSLLGQGGAPEMLYEGPTVYSRLREAGIPSFVFLFHEYAGSAYSRMVHRGAAVVSFATATDLYQKLIGILAREPRGYFFVYWNIIDTIEHAFGPGSNEHLTALADFSSLTLKRFFKRLPPAAAANTLLLLGADHGQSAIDREEIIYLNNFFTLEQSYLKNKSARYIRPTGAPHDVFLFLYPPLLEKMLGFLRQEFEGKAEVLTVEEGVKQGLFGLGQPTEKFLRRAGNVLILPYRNRHVWYKHFPDSQYHHQGTHGGLLPEEMLVPLAVCDLPRLLDR